MEPWFIDYIYEFGFGTVAVRVAAQGKSLVRLTANLGPKQEIGVYQRELTEAQTGRVHDLFDQAKADTLTPSEDFPPETACITLGKGIVGGPAQLRCFVQSELPQQLYPLRDHMKSVIEEIRAEPYRVLEGKAELVAPALAVNNPMVFTVTMKNIGVVPAEIHHPAGAPGDDQVRLMLYIAADKPLAELKNNDSADIWLKRMQITPLAHSEDLDAVPEIVELLPDDAIRMRVRCGIHLEPGRYKAAVTYHGVLGPIDMQRGIEGSLTMDLGRLEITR